MKLAVLNPELELAVEDVTVKQVETHSLDPQDQIAINQELIIIMCFLHFSFRLTLQM